MSVNLTKSMETRRLKVDGTNYTGAAATTDLTSETVDTQGYEGVRFIAGFGAITSGAVTTIRVRQGAASDMSDAADLAGTAQTIADTDDNKVVISEIVKPRERYLNFITDRGTQNAVVDFLLVELIRPRVVPITQHSTVLGAETHVSPAEGTA